MLLALTPLDDQTAAEELLVEYLRQLAARPGARQAVVVSLSRLPASAQREACGHAITTGLTRLAEEHHGELFVLANADIVFFFAADAAPVVAREVGAFRLMLSESRLLAADAGEAGLIDWLDPHVELGRLLALARTVQARAAQRAMVVSAAADQHAAGYSPPPVHFDVLTPFQLDRLEAGLAQADVLSLLRRHAVCAVVEETRPEPAFVACTVSIADLTRTMLPESNLCADPHLFRYLTAALDRRMLALMATPDGIGGDDVIGITLNVATLLSEAFFAFDERLVAARRGRIVVEIKLDDFLSDLEGFRVARALCRAKGYRLCLDGLSAPALDLIDPALPDFEFVKLPCPAGGLEDPATSGPWLSSLVARAGVGRFILSHVESAAALAFGRDCGVRLFQGRHIDRLLADARQRRHFRRLNRATAQDT